MKNFLDLAKDRFSVRAFSDKPVEEDKIKYILEAAQCAPTAKNCQPQHIYIARSESALKKLNELTACTYGAKQVFVVCSDGTDCVNPHINRKYGEMDASIACTHMMLAATDVGIGTCWVCNYDPQKVKLALGLPENMTVWCLMPFGYAKDDCVPSDRHTLRKPLEELYDII